MSEELKKEQIIRNISVKAFLGNGKPTCAIDFEDPQNGVCRFLGLEKFGCVEVCSAMVESIQIQREFGDTGFLRPVKGCPVWEDSNWWDQLPKKLETP